MAENEIFRKTSLERISSPEKLNEYIKITNPSLIAILVAIFAILAACCSWIFSGNIPKYMDITGVAVTKSDGNQYIYSYVPISSAKRMSEGMEAQISPDYASREEYGYKQGTIIKVGKEISTYEDLENNFSNPSIVTPILPTDGSNFVEIVIDQGKWSNEKGESIDITDGSTCNVSVVIGEQKPYKLIFNN